MTSKTTYSGTLDPLDTSSFMTATKMLSSEETVDAAVAFRNSLLGLASVAVDFVARENRKAEADSRESLSESRDFGSW